MAYATRWWTSFNNLGQNASRTIYIKEDSYVGSSSEIESLAEEPYNYRNRGINEFSIGEIVGAEVEFSFWVTPADGSAYDDLFTATQRKYIIQIDNGGTTEFYGFLNPSNLSKTLIGNRYMVTLSASDGLALLRNYEYVDSSGDNYNDRVSLLTVIKRALSFVGFDLDFNIKLGTYHNTSSLMTSTQCALDKTTVNNKRFYKEQNGVYKPLDCASVITQCLGIFNCSLRQIDGAWFIYSNVEVSSYVFNFDWSTLTQQSRTVHNKSLAIDAYSFGSKGDLAKRPPLSRIGITFENLYEETNLITNGAFDSNITGWTNGGSPNNWYSFAWLAGTLKTTIIASLTDDKYFISDTFYLNEIDSSNTIAIGLRAIVDSITYTTPDPLGAGLPYLEALVENTTTSESVLINLGQMSENWKIHNPTTERFTMGDGDYQITIIVKADANITNLICRFDDIDVHVNLGGAPVTVDTLVTVSNDNAIDENPEEYTTRIGDVNETNDQGGLMISSTLTSEWRTYGNTEDEPLITLLGAHQLNQRNEFCNYIRVIIKDPNDTIHADSILSYDGVYYRIIRFAKQFNNMEVSADLMELTT